LVISAGITQAITIQTNTYLEDARMAALKELASIQNLHVCQRSIPRESKAEIVPSSFVS